MAWDISRRKIASDAAAATSTHIVWGKGAAGEEVEATELDRTAMTLASAVGTNPGDPAIVGLASPVTSGNPSSEVIVTCRAFAASGTASASDLTTTWVRFPTPKTVGTDDTIGFDAGSEKCIEVIFEDDAYTPE